MPQFLTVVNRTLIIGYIVCILPLMAGFVTGHPVPGISQTPWAHFIQTQRQSVLAKSKMTALNLFMPADFSVLYEFLRPGSKEGVRLPYSYIPYFRQVVQILPPVFAADAYAMLGFCYFHEGKIKESYESYTKSLEGNPAFLWTYYNLATIEFKARRYDRTVFLLEQMFKLNPEISARVISSSKIYTDVLRSHQGPFDFFGELKATYGDAMRLMVASLYQMKKFPELLTASQYAVVSGFEPAGVFNYYAGLAADALGDAAKAEALRKSAGQGAGDTYTGQDISVRFF